MTDKEVERLISKRATKCADDTPKTPEILYFSGVVRQTKKRLARRQNIQFAIFIAASVIVVMAEMLCFFTSVAVFAVVQILPVVLFCILCPRARRTEATR